MTPHVHPTKTQVNVQVNNPYLKKIGKSLKRDNRSLDAFKADEKKKKTK